ncbi:MAG TPA: SpoIIE family protein phosphatase [Candidatus Ozemobacteraceae bacterium]|nr:SpoIIE family protein phosphatase [Candidatus Ozemobacteraceae bacterium]
MVSKDGSWLAFFLAVLFFAGLPIGLIRLGEAFVAAQEKNRLGRAHLGRLEQNLFRLKREGGDLYYIQRQLNELYGLLLEDDFSGNAVASSASALRRANLGFVTAHFFDSGGEVIPVPGRKIEMRSAMKRIYAGLVEPELHGKSDLIVKNRSLFQSMLGNIDPSDVVYQKGSLVSTQIMGRPGYFYWNTFYTEAQGRHGGRQTNRAGDEALDEYRGGIVAFFEERDIPRDFALKQLLRRFNGEAAPGEGYALIDIERPEESHAVRTLARRTGLRSQEILRRVVGLRNTYQRQDQDNECLTAIVALDAGRVVAGMKRFEHGLERHVGIMINILSVMILLVAGYWSWRVHVADDMVSISIRHKLVGLFLYATAIPVTALLLLGYQYMLDRNQVMVQERVSQLSGLTENIDESFMAAVRSLEKLYRRISRLAYVRNGDSRRIRSLSRRLNDADLLSQMFMVDSKGHMQLLEDMNPRGRDLIGKLIPTLARKIFAARLGQSDNDLRANMSDVMVESFTDSIAEFMSGKGSQRMFGSIIEANDKIIEFMLGNVGNLMYSTFVWGEGEKRPANLLLIVHRTREYARKYLRNIVRQNQLRSENVAPVRLAMASRGDGYSVYPRDYTKYPFVKEMAEKVQATETQHASVENIGGQPYLVVASPLKKMPDFILITMYPRRLIDAVIRNNSVKIGLVALVSGCFAFFIGLLLSRHFLWPINQLAAGVTAIERREFSHQVPPLGSDEFGDLGTTFNRVIANLEEMHVGKIVQETLFPKMPVAQGEYELYGATDSMTDLGGDYFDSFTVGDRHLVTIIGDVTGHGVPAALLMAMAKSGVAMLGPGESVRAVEAMDRLNRMVFETVKKKRLMSLIYAVLDTQLNNVELVNAGHCFPFLHRFASGETSEIEKPAFPLGARKNGAFESVSITMNPGDSLILYTDGIVEAKDSGNVVIGYSRLRRIAGEACASARTAEALHADILRRVKSLIGSRMIEDDVTLLVIRRRNG